MNKNKRKPEFVVDDAVALSHIETWNNFVSSNIGIEFLAWMFMFNLEIINEKQHLSNGRTMNKFYVRQRGEKEPQLKNKEREQPYVG